MASSASSSSSARKSARRAARMSRPTSARTTRCLARARGLLRSRSEAGGISESGPRTWCDLRSKRSRRRHTARQASDPRRALRSPHRDRARRLGRTPRRLERHPRGAIGLERAGRSPQRRVRRVLTVPRRPHHRPAQLRLLRGVLTEKADRGPRHGPNRASTPTSQIGHSLTRITCTRNLWWFYECHHQHR